MKIRIDEMTWIEIKEALEAGKKTVIVPIGSIEQHGPHLPEGTDTFAGDIIAEKIALKMGNALVAPTIRPGCSQHHMEFPGTITLAPETLMQVIREVCYSLVHHGFENIVLLPTHGGNFAPTATVAPEIAREMKDVNVIALTDLKELIVKMNEVMAEYGVSFEDAGAHAGASETSLMLAYKEELVRSDLAKKGYTGKYTSAQLFRKGLRAFSEIGVLGDPTKASKEAGLKMIDILAEYYAKKIKEEIEI